MNANATRLVGFSQATTVEELREETDALRERMVNAMRYWQGTYGAARKKMGATVAVCAPATGAEAQLLRGIQELEEEVIRRDQVLALLK